MEGKNKLLVALVVIALLIFGGVTGFFYFSDKETFKKTTSDREFVPPPDLITKTAATPVPDKFTIGTKEVSRELFKKVENGSIYYGDYILPLTEDQVALVCTSQDLASEDAVDYRLATDVKALTPDTVMDNVRKGEPVIVLANDDSGILTAHTLVISSASCPE